MHKELSFKHYYIIIKNNYKQSTDKQPNSQLADEGPRLVYRVSHYDTRVASIKQITNKHHLKAPVDRRR